MSRRWTLTSAFAGLFAGLLLCVGLGAAQASILCPNYNYFPTGAVNDGRFLALAGSNSGTFAGGTLSIEFSVPLHVTEFQIGIFDGDTGSYRDASGNTVPGDPKRGYWDIGTTALEYSLYTDKSGTGEGQCLVGRWVGNGGNCTLLGGQNAAPMPDNDWYDLCVRTGLAALNLNGHYYYVLKVRSTDPLSHYLGSFKLRSTAVLSVPPQTISLYCPLSYFQELDILTPPGQPSHYDGTWDLNFALASDVDRLEVWDGDMDTGNAATLVPQTYDDDDPDTPAASLPSWAVGTEAVPEAVAVSDPGVVGKGSPADDTASIYHHRAPNPCYEIYRLCGGDQPDGNVYRNLNPSGNREWERFVVTTDLEATRSEADYAPGVAADGQTFVPAGRLQAGNWRLRLRGIDAGNLNAYRFSHAAVGSFLDGLPVVSSLPIPLPMW